MRHLDVSWRKAPVVLLVVGCWLFEVRKLGENMLVVWVRGNAQPQCLQWLAVTIHRGIKLQPHGNPQRQYPTH